PATNAPSEQPGRRWPNAESWCQPCCSPHSSMGRLPRSECPAALPRSPPGRTPDHHIPNTCSNTVNSSSYVRIEATLVGRESVGHGGTAIRLLPESEGGGRRDSDALRDHPVRRADARRVPAAT